MNNEEEGFNVVTKSKDKNLNTKLLVYEGLRIVAEEYEKSSRAVDAISKEQLAKETDRLFFTAVCVIFINELDSISSKVSLKYQTFRITLNTTFKELKEYCQDIWEIENEKKNNYTLKFFDGDALYTLSANRDTEKIDLYLKNKSNISKAKFVYVDERQRALSKKKKLKSL